MPKSSISEFICQRVREFGRARGGNITLTFGLALIPMAGLAGSAIDYSRGNSVKAAMQAAADATALALSKDAANLTTSQINSKATSYFNALFTRTDVTNVSVTPAYSTGDGSQIVIKASGNLTTTVLKVVGFPSLNIDVSSTVKWGNARVRVALVLDNTGSMSSSNKMNALKNASKALINQLKDASSNNGDVYVSIIPFSKDVNVDPINVNKDWIKWSGADDTWDENNGTCKNYSGGGNAPKTKPACSKKGGTWTPDNHSKWTGCVTDRDQDYDTKNTAPAPGNPATLFPAEQYPTCPVPLMALSNDWVALGKKIDDMKPDGNTNQAIGLQWGFQSLTAAPFTIPPKDSNYTYKEVIILLTDGLNTENRWSNKAAPIDARQKITCDNVKAAKITLYTIQVNTSGDPTSTLLKDCASSPDKFFLLTSANAMVTVFNQIGTELSDLRVAK
jgi:Flp pilus assembly protein TadG